MKAWITIGYPECGKEIWARAMARLCRVRTLSQELIMSELREEMAAPLYFDTWDQEWKHRSDERWQERLHFFVERRYDIVLADDNLRCDARANLAKYLIKHGYDVKYVWFDVPVEECRFRNLGRGFFAVPDTEFSRLTPLFDETRVALQSEARELGVGVIEIKTTRMHKLMDDGGRALNVGDIVHNTDYQIHADRLDRSGFSFSPPLDCWIGRELTGAHPVFIRA